MKEILRLRDVTYRDLLVHYNLSISEREIVCIQSSESESIDVLLRLITGGGRPEQGMIYLDGLPYAGMRRDRLKESNVYVLSLSMRYSDQTFVYENVEKLEKPWKIYNPHRERARVEEYFRKEQIQINPLAPVWKISETDRKKLGILWAKLNGARLVVMDLRKENVEGQVAEELRSIIQKANQEGVAFLLLSNRYTPVFNLDCRFQYLDMGRVLKEWTRLPEKAKIRLLYGKWNTLEAIKKAQLSGNPNEEKADAQPLQKELTGLYEYGWDASTNFWNYLKEIRFKNPDLWEKEFGVELPEENCGWGKDTAVIPRNSQDHLLKNMTIGENLTIMSGGRVTWWRTDIIHERLEENLVQHICREWKLPDAKETIEILSPLQKKIISIERFALLHPKVIFLESPYQRLQPEEYARLLLYLHSLKKRRIHIVIFAQDLEKLRMDCNSIFSVDRGKIAKIDTES